MPDKNHWPFGTGDSSGASYELDRNREREAEREALRSHAAQTQHEQTRMNRLLVGGRAHVRQRGLS